jgi:uncharacterized coiled-coil protein SlyX
MCNEELATRVSRLENELKAQKNMTMLLRKEMAEQRELIQKLSGLVYEKFHESKNNSPRGSIPGLHPPADVPVQAEGELGEEGPKATEIETDFWDFDADIDIDWTAIESLGSATGEQSQSEVTSSFGQLPVASRYSSAVIFNPIFDNCF